MTGDLDMRGKKIILPGEIDMDQKLITNLDTDTNQDLSAVNMITMKNTVSPKADTAYVDRKARDLNHMVSLLNTRKLSNPSGRALVMQNQFIKGVKVDANDQNSAVNVSFLKTTVNDSNAELYTRLTTDYKSYVNESHISSSTTEKDTFRYLMEDVDESSSESNITVTGITDFAASPHQINKKAYDVTLTTDAEGNFGSRIGFNAYKLPEGEYTLVVEFFVPDKTQISATTVTAVSTAINIGQQTTKIFSTAGYTRSIIHLHKWRTSPPEYIMLDLHGSVSNVSHPVGKKGYLIVYGVQGHVSDVDPRVFDTAFVIEGGKVLMETDLNMGSHRIMNTIHHIHGILQTDDTAGKTFLLNGCDKIIIPNNSQILEIKAMYFNLDLAYPAISLNIRHGPYINQQLILHPQQPNYKRYL